MFPQPKDKYSLASTEPKVFLLPSMDKQEINSFLEEPNIARIATVDEEGVPYVVPVWYDWDGQYLYIVGRKYSKWVEHLRRKPRVSILIDEDAWPYRKVIFRGRAEILGGEWAELGRRMSIKYHGPEIGSKYFEGTFDQPRWVVRVKPLQTTSWMLPPNYDGGREGWHHRYYEQGSRWYKEYQKETRQTSRR